jgi:carbon monoxide dehydrogenase subunit G
MDMTPFRLRESVTVAAPPEAVWARVSDVTRMGEVSPACTGCEWDDPATGMADGAWFTGHNHAGEHTYSTRCQITDYTPGRAFAFLNHSGGNHSGGDAPLSKWGYEVEATDGGSILTEIWEMLPGFVELVQARGADIDVAQVAEERKAFAQNGIAATLAALKAELEQ